MPLGKKRLQSLNAQILFEHLQQTLYVPAFLQLEGPHVFLREFVSTAWNNAESPALNCWAASNDLPAGSSSLNHAAELLNPLVHFQRTNGQVSNAIPLNITGGCV